MRSPLHLPDHHGPCVVWFTGLSGAGKTTIAKLVEADLVARGRRVFVLDGDALRAGLCRDLSFSASDRSENLRRAAEVAALVASEGFIVLAAFITPRQEDRDRIRSRFATQAFMEVFVDTPLDVAERRDPKGLYRRARLGQISNFTGIDSPFDPPTLADLRLDTVANAAVDLAKTVVRTILATRGFATSASAPMPPVTAQQK